jgi:hypothetical protein
MRVGRRPTGSFLTSEIGESVTMKTTTMRMAQHAFTGKVSWALVVVIAVGGICGWIAKSVGGFEFAPDAPNKFLTKLPVFFLVALLIERTGEIFLTIWRGGPSVRMEAEIEQLASLKNAAPARKARLEALSAEIDACEKAILGRAGSPRKQVELKAQEDRKAALKREEAALQRDDEEQQKLETDPLYKGRQGETPKESKVVVGTLENRTLELTDYKNRTRSVAMTFSFALALFISACGFRAMEGLVIPRPVEASVQTAAPALDAALLKGLTQQLTTKIRADRESLEKATEAGAREIIKRQQDDAWSGWLAGELKDKVPAVITATSAPGGTATSPPTLTALAYEIYGFRFGDMLLTAGLLAGGADPLSRIMKLLRDFLDQSSKRVNEKEK